MLDQPNDAAVINKSRNDLIYNSQGTAIIVVCLVVLGLATSLYGSVPKLNLILWSGLCILSYIARYGLCLSYSKSPVESKSSDTWQKKFSISSSISGLIWGAAAFAIFPESNRDLQLILILIVVFLAAGTMITHSAYRWAGLGFSSCSLIPIAIKLFTLSDPGQHEVAGFILGIWIVMVSSSFHLSKNANRMFELTYTNAKLVDDLKLKNTELEQYNLRLEDTKNELSQANDRLQKLITSDALTGLTNRRRFDALTRLKWQRCMADKTPVSLLLLNIDNFKRFNDVYGHRKGDSVLLAIGSYLGQVPEINRNSDCVSRYSGDEFAVLLVDADEQYTVKVAEKLRSDVELLRIPCSEVPGGVSPWVSISVGTATEKEFSHNSFENLIEHADRAMYTAKRGGRNQVATYEAGKIERSAG